MRDRGARLSGAPISCVECWLPRGQLAAGWGELSRSLEGQDRAEEGGSEDMSQMLSLVRDVCCHGICEGPALFSLKWWTMGLGAQRGHDA